MNPGFGLPVMDVCFGLAPGKGGDLFLLDEFLLHFVKLKRRVLRKKLSTRSQCLKFYRFHQSFPVAKKNHHNLHFHKCSHQNSNHLFLLSVRIPSFFRS